MVRKSKEPEGMSLPVKFGISIVWDIADAVVGFIPIVGVTIGTVMDIVSIPVAVALWGWGGLTAAWEIIEPSNALDAFVPTMTVIGIFSTIKGGKNV